MRSLIVDDEPGSRARLIRMLGSHPEISVIGEAQDGLEAVEKIETLKPDLLFLDIQMPGLTGFDVLRSIRPRIPLPLVIFITGYDQHALAAFQADALAYLLNRSNRYGSGLHSIAPSSWKHSPRRKRNSGRVFCGLPAQCPVCFVTSSAENMDTLCLFRPSRSYGSRYKMALSGLRLPVIHFG